MRVVWRSEYARWCVTAGGMVIKAHELKDDAVETACAFARELYADHGIPAQVLIHLKSGRFESERTYPDKTPRRKG
jgi:hypothetical protein